MKDPAFLFYPGDWLGGTLTFSRSHKGAYMDLLMAQHSSGHMTIEDIKTVLGTDFDPMWESKLKSKFKQDDNGLYFNQKLEEVMAERAGYKQGRLENLKGKKAHKEAHKGIPYGSTVCGNGNINKDLNNNIGVPPEKSTVLTFDEFWDLYDKKVGKKAKLIKKYAALSEADREKIKAHIPLYKEAQPDKQFRKDPQTYINNESWNDEVISKYGNKTQNSAAAGSSNSIFANNDKLFYGVES